MDLPQRPRAIERAGEDPRHLLGQLLVGSAGRQRQLAYVEVQVEVSVVDPVAIVEVEGNRHEAPAKRRHQREAFGDQQLEVFER
jgi:hypothetical protein